MRPFRNLIASAQLRIIFEVHAWRCRLRQQLIPRFSPRHKAVLEREVLASARISDENDRYATGAQFGHGCNATRDLLIKCLLIVSGFLRCWRRLVEFLCPDGTAEGAIDGVGRYLAPQVGIAVSFSVRQLAHVREFHQALAMW